VIVGEKDMEKGGGRQRLGRGSSRKSKGVDSVLKGGHAGVDAGA